MSPLGRIPGTAVFAPPLGEPFRAVTGHRRRRAWNRHPHGPSRMSPPVPSSRGADPALRARNCSRSTTPTRSSLAPAAGPLPRPTAVLPSGGPACGSWRPVWRRPRSPRAGTPGRHQVRERLTSSHTNMDDGCLGGPDQRGKLRRPAQIHVPPGVRNRNVTLFQPLAPASPYSLLSLNDQ
jgi:hypothetical protein